MPLDISVFHCHVAAPGAFLFLHRLDWFPFSPVGFAGRSIFSHAFAFSKALRLSAPFRLRSGDLEAISLRLRRFFSVPSNRRSLHRDSSSNPPSFCFCLPKAPSVKGFRLIQKLIDFSLARKSSTQAGFPLLFFDSCDGGMSSEIPVF